MDRHDAQAVSRDSRQGPLGGKKAHRHEQRKKIEALLSSKNIEPGYTVWKELWTPEGYKRACLDDGLPESTYYDAIQQLYSSDKLIRFLDPYGSERLLLLSEDMRTDYAIFKEVKHKLMQSPREDSLENLDYLEKLDSTYLVIFSLGIREIAKKYLLDADTKVRQKVLRILYKVTRSSPKLLQEFEADLIKLADDLKSKTPESETDQLMLSLLVSTMTEEAIDKSLNFVAQRNSVRPRYFRHNVLLEKFHAISPTLKTHVKSEVKTWMVGERDEELKAFAKTFVSMPSI